MRVDSITPGERLKHVIECQAIKMRDFALITGIDPSTLSRYVNGKQPMPPRYIKKAAEFLNVSPEYLLCESNDPTPPVFQIENEGISQEMLDYNLQQYRFNGLTQLLTRLGITFVMKIQIEDKIYIANNQLQWNLEGGTDEDTLDEIEGVKQMYKHQGQCKVWVEMTYKDRRVTADYADFHKWLKSILAMIEIYIQGKFDVSFSVSTFVADTDIDRALKGADRLRYDDKDTYNIYDQKRNGENSSVDE